MPAEASAGELRTLLARAYARDPLLAWVFPDEPSRQEATAAWLGVTVERYLAAGEVELVREGAVTAAALWRLPSTVLPADPGSLPTAAGLLQALVGASRAAEVAEGFAAARQQAPPPAGAYPYLHFLAVDPDAQRRGHGGRLLDRVLERSRAQEVPLRLDTTNPDNLSFYEAHGLVVRSEARLGPTGPVIWGLEATRGR